MNPILTYRPGEIRDLQDVALANRLADFINTQYAFMKSYENPLIAAQRRYRKLQNTASEKTSKKITVIGYIIFFVIMAGLCFGVYLAFARPSNAIWLVILFGPLVFKILISIRDIFKPTILRKRFYQKELKKQEAEIISAQRAIDAAKQKYDAANQSPEMCVLNEFLGQEGSDLDHEDLLELHRIVKGGYARTFAQAKNVLAQRKHNQRVEDIAEERRKQELQHQREMEREAARQRIAQQEHYRQQQQHNREQEITARETGREVQKAANAVYDYYHK